MAPSDSPLGERKIKKDMNKFFDKEKTSYATADPTIYKLLKEHSHHMRLNPTDAEALLWKYLACSQLGKPFRRQHIIGSCIADFACLPAKLVIELDGAYHDNIRQQYHDELRTVYLEQMGFRVIRFRNEDVYGRIEYVIDKIKNIL